MSQLAGFTTYDLFPFVRVHIGELTPKSCINLESGYRFGPVFGCLPVETGKSVKASLDVLESEHRDASKKLLNKFVVKRDKLLAEHNITHPDTYKKKG